jgi:hypothetical protein
MIWHTHVSLCIDGSTGLSFLEELFALIRKYEAADLKIGITKEPPQMAKQNVKFDLCPKSGAKKAVANPVTITGPVSITLTVVDAAGVPVPGVTADAVTTTVVSDNPAVTISAGADSLHYSGSIPAGTTGVANLAATCAFKSGSPGPFSASVQATLNIPPSPPVPADLTITVSPS